MQRHGQRDRAVVLVMVNTVIAGEFRHRLFPMLAVEQRDAGHAHLAVVEAAHIDAEAVRL